MSCACCDRSTITSGKDKLWLEMASYYIVENGNTDGYFRRVSLVITKHHAGNPIIEWICTQKLRAYLAEELHIPNAEFFIEKTMNTYPDHFHIHAYILPKLKESDA